VQEDLVNSHPETPGHIDQMVPLANSVGLLPSLARSGRFGPGRRNRELLADPQPFAVGEGVGFEDGVDGDVKPFREIDDPIALTQCIRLGPWGGAVLGAGCEGTEERQNGGQESAPLATVPRLP
jgi:hypothetical protein